MGVKSDCYYLVLMTGEGVKLFSSFCIPKFGSFVKGPCRNFVTELSAKLTQTEY